VGLVTDLFFDLIIFFNNFISVELLSHFNKTKKMNKIFLLIALGLLLVQNSTGQWIQKKYGVPDMHDLSDDQLKVVKQDAGYLTLGTWCMAACGVALYFIGKDVRKNGLGDSPTPFEEIIGNKNAGNLYMGLGVLLFAGGSAGGIVGLARLSSVKSVIRERNSVNGSFSLSPAIIYNNHYGTINPGISLRINF
jgi:hypothetical protein